jgi:hypothetical protein
MAGRRRFGYLPHPWVAFVALLVVGTGVVIALATPGPWHSVLPTARVDLVSKPPADIAVFLDGKGAARPHCDMILWLHAGYERPTLAVIVVPPAVLVTGAGGASSPAQLGDLVAREGAAAGAHALGKLLGVHVGGWMTVDRDALLGSLGASALGAEILGVSGPGLTEAAFGRQVSALRALVLLAPRKDIPVHALENYVLASGEARTSLGLNGVASLGKLLRDAPAAHLQVLGLPARLGAGVWSADAAGVRGLVARLRGW